MASTMLLPAQADSIHDFPSARMQPGAVVRAAWQEVVNAAQGEGIVEEAGQEFGDAAEGTVADQRASEDELAQPRLGNG